MSRTLTNHAGCSHVDFLHSYTLQSSNHASAIEYPTLNIQFSGIFYLNLIRSLHYSHMIHNLAKYYINLYPKGLASQRTPRVLASRHIDTTILIQLILFSSLDYWEFRVGYWTLKKLLLTYLLNYKTKMESGK